MLQIDDVNIRRNAILDGQIEPKVLEAKRHSKKYTKTNPWKIHNKWYNEDVEIDFIIDLLKKIESDSLTFAAIFAIIFLSGARLHEILPKIFKNKNKEVIGTFPGVCVKDIKMKTDKNGIEFLTIRSAVEKLRNKYVKMHPESKYKTVIILANHPDHKPFIEVLERYSDYLDKIYNGNTSENVPLFYKITDYSFYRYLVKNHGINVHIIRHWRAKHLSRIFNFSESDLIAYFGWVQDSVMSHRYSKSSEFAMMQRQIVNAAENNIQL